MPESDPSRSFAVTKTSNMQISPSANISLSQTPSANVSLALTRSSELSVQYAVDSWSVSAHRVINGEHLSQPAIAGKTVNNLLTFLNPQRMRTIPSANREALSHSCKRGPGATAQPLKNSSFRDTSGSGRQLMKTQRS